MNRNIAELPGSHEIRTVKSDFTSDIVNKGVEGYLREVQENAPEIIDNVSVLLVDSYLINNSVSPQELYKDIRQHIDQYPDDLIVCVSMMRPEVLTDPDGRCASVFKELAGMPNIALVNLLDGPEAFIETVKNRAQYEKTAEEAQAAKELLVKRHVETILPRLQHDLKYLLKEDDAHPRKRAILDEARQAVGQEMSDKALTEMVMNYTNRLEKVMEGHIPGLYCDIEGTLLDAEGNMNKKIFTLVKKFKDGGTQVTLWTGGDPQVQQERLVGTPLEGIEVRSKRDFCGAEPEFVIDDLPRAAFEAQYGISPVGFIQAKSV